MVQSNLLVVVYKVMGSMGILSFTLVATEGWLELVKNWLDP